MSQQSVAPNHSMTASGPPSPPNLGWPTFALLAVAYLYAFPYFDAMRSANEMPRLLQTLEIVDKGHFWLDERRHEMGSQFDTSYGPDGRQYPNKAPGPSLLAVPVYAVAKVLGVARVRALMWAFRVVAVTLPALLFLPFFYRLTAHFTEDENARRLTLLAYALGSPALVYGVLFMSHVLAAVCAGGAFVASVGLVRGTSRRPRVSGLLVGALSSASVMMDYQAALAAGLVGGYFLLARERVRNLAWAALGAAPIVGLLGYYHTVCFGSPLRTGYHFSVDEVTRKGFMGIVGPSVESFFSTTFLPSNGLFVLAPWILHAFIGAFSIAYRPDLRRRAGKEAALCLTVFVVYVAFLSSLDPYMARGGWCVGPRYLTVALPFAAWLSAAGFAVMLERPLLRALSVASVVCAVVVFVCAALTYPHWPDPLRNPLYEVTFRLLASGRSVHSMGHWLGLPARFAALPLLGLALGLAVWLSGATRRVRAGTTLAGFLVGALWLSLYSLFPTDRAQAEGAWQMIVAHWEP